MKILFTGMASSHCSPSKNVGFFNTLGKLLSEKLTVEWDTPKLDWTAEKIADYDVVIFGLIPPTSPSGNRAYAALNFLSQIYDSPKLRLVIDTPQLWQYRASLKATATNASKAIFSPFFMKRYDYLAASRDSKVVENIQSVAKKLYEEAWPRTLYPALPWSTTENLKQSLGLGAEGDAFIGLNLDAYLLNQGIYQRDRNASWAADDARLSWSKQVAEALANPVVDVRVSRSFDDSDAADVISHSIGLLLPPQERGIGTWWSYRLIQAMNSKTPVATNWSETYSFSPSWALLAYQIEDLTASDRIALAEMQKEDYINHIPTKSQAWDQVVKALGE